MRGRFPALGNQEAGENWASRIARQGPSGGFFRDMHPQLQTIVDDFGRAEKRLHRLVADVEPYHVWATCAGARPW
jgi:hypothetical protein